MKPLRAALLANTIRRAEEIILGCEGEGPHLDEERVAMAAAVVHLRDAVSHYERTTSWNVDCQRCARVMEKLYAAERRGDEAESALLAHLALHHVEHGGV